MARGFCWTRTLPPPTPDGVSGLMRGAPGSYLSTAFQACAHQALEVVAVAGPLSVSVSGALHPGLLLVHWAPLAHYALIMCLLSTAPYHRGNYFDFVLRFYKGYRASGLAFCALCDARMMLMSDGRSAFAAPCILLH